ncbi:MAG: riboflavin kinase [Candidatus Paceibacterota bacterium]
MVFQSRHIKGIGRGKNLGFPTINLTIPEEIMLEEGIYAAWVDIGGRAYKGALHFGPVPTFGEKESQLEVYLIDVTDDNFPNTDGLDIEVDIVEYIRDIQMFDETVDLVEQIARDVEKVNRILK